jgi:glutamate synthase (NADPH) small chain
VVGGGDTSIDVASVARRLGHIETINPKDLPESIILGHTAHDVASTAVREGAKVTLTSLFPVKNMTAAEREVEDALSEGVDIRGGIMPLEVIRDASGRATGLRMCECDVVKNAPVPKEGTEFLIEADLIVSAIGQKGDLTGLEALDNGKGFINADKHFQVSNLPGHFVGGDIVRPHLLTTAIGHGSVAAEGIDQYLQQHELGRRPKVDVHHFDLLGKLREFGLEPEEGPHTNVHGTSSAKFAVHNFEDRAAHEVIPADELFLGHFNLTPRNRREEIKIAAEAVIGNFQERLRTLSDAQAVAEAKRCMSCGMCFECDNCVVFCPQEAVKRTPKAQATTGRYVFTDYSRCIGCHICHDVCPTGYIQMGLGE